MENCRGRIRSSSALVAVFAACVLAGPVYGQGAGPDISGTYWATQYNAKVALVGGGELPLTPAGKGAYEKNMAGLKDGSISDDARKYCTPDGPVRMSFSEELYDFGAAAQVQMPPPSLVTDATKLKLLGR